MSQKNFASYGDMETLMTEIADKCGPYTEITYEEWLQLTPYQQEHGRWDVTGVPGADGTISIDLMTKLWENPSPTASFAAQNITDLPLSDYDFILYATGDAGGINAVNIRHIIEVSGSSATIKYVFRRVFTPNVSTGVIAISDCAGFKIQDGTESTFNTINIPTAIYGIKLHHTVEIKAIAPTVSTLASKCMMSDGETSVEEAVNGLIDIVGKVNSVSLSSAVSIPKSTITTVLSLNLTPGTYLINGAYLGFGLEASYFKSMLLMIGDSSSIAVDRRSDGSSGGGTITAVVVVPANNTYTIKFKLMHTYTSSLNVSNAYLNSIKIA